MISILRARRVGLAAVVAAGLALFPAATAFAHVTVSSPDAAPGGFGKLVFRVPSESDTANTVQLTVDLPTDTPLRFVSVRAVPGWTAEPVVTELAEPFEGDGFTLTEAVTQVTWTAEGEGLAPHQFTEFELSVGPFPDDVEELIFPATQTYSDGEVVEWSELAEEGQEEPEHPAPVLSLSADDSATAANDDSSTDTVARVLGVAGVVLGGAGLAFGLNSRRSGSRSA
jgi:periplasmic copper chaperone A